jgi:hypothetical protein
MCTASPKARLCVLAYKFSATRKQITHAKRAQRYSPVKFCPITVKYTLVQTSSKTSAEKTSKR